MVYRVAIIGHSQVPKSIQAIPDVEIRIYRKSGARLGNFENYEEFQELFNWHNDLNIIFLGGNDIPSMPAKDIAEELIALARRFAALGQDVTLVQIEPRTYTGFSQEFADQYNVEMIRVNRKLKRLTQRQRACYSLINYTASPYHVGHTLDGVHFQPLCKAYIKAKMVGCINHHIENPEHYNMLRQR